MGWGFLISLGAVGALFAGDHYLYRRHMRKKREKERLERKQRIEYNKAHLPSMELPKLSPDMEAVEELISKAPRLVLLVIDEKLHYRNGDELVCIQDVYSEDALMFIRHISSDLSWFHSHWVGEELAEQCRTLEDYLTKKYRLSDKCVQKLSNEFALEHIF